jgi:hypothetical protein
VELYADSLEAADPKRLTYVIFNSKGKEVDRRKGKSILAPRSSVFPTDGRAVIKLIYLQSKIRCGCGFMMNFAAKPSVSTCLGQKKSRIARAAINSYHHLASVE